MAHFVANIQPSLSEISHAHGTSHHDHRQQVQHPVKPPHLHHHHQSDGNTAFLRAARAGHLDKVLEQLKNNVDINTSNANGLNALHLASKDGHIAVVDELLKRGAHVDSATKKGNTALHIASLAGQEEVVRRLVEAGACVNVQSQNGFTPLYMAAQENHDSVVRFLLSNGANQSLATEDGFTPLAVAMQQGHDKVVAVLLENDTRGKVRLPALHIAAKKDDCKAAALLLQNEHNPDVTSKSGFTPLHIAAHYGNEAIASLLLSKGADVNYAAKHNITPLHVAAKWGKANMVAVLLSRGANIEAKTRDGLTPLHCAARSGHEQVVDMLLERGAPISAKTKNGLAPLHMSSQGDHVDAARILLYHRAPVDDVTVDYLTALHVAAHCGHVSVARLLLDRKADPNARALNGFTPLHIACKKNRIKVVELLLKHGASIEATTESGLTPLHVASFMGCMNIVIYLVQNEAHPDVKTVRGETPLHLAARANQTDIIRILLRNGAQVDARAREEQTPLHIASRLGNVDIVMLLLQHGASVDSTTKDLYTALHIAAKEGQDEVASVLLENGASLEATTKKGFTPLHLAAKYGNINVAKLLLRREAPVDAQGKNGVTPLHVASHYDHQNVALLLLEKGASPHATAKNGHTPLHIAARKNQMDIATTLLEYGAKANAESKAGFTPLHLSAQEGHTDMSNLLIEHQADVNHKAKNGLSPLHLCSQEDRVDVAQILIKNNAQVDATTKAGYTPLHVASHFGQMGMVKLLLQSGADIGPVTAVNYTPLHQAAQQGHSTIVATLLDAGADPNAMTNQGQTALSIAQKLGYITVVETLKPVTAAPISPTPSEEKYKVVSPETMQETFMSDSEDEGGEDTMLSEQPYHYLTVDEMKGLGDDSLPIDVTRDERDNRDNIGPPTAIDDTISPQHLKETYTQFHMSDNVDIHRHPQQVGFLVSFLVDARGGAMRGCRHSGVRVIVPPRRAPMPLRVTCRYLKRDKLPHPPPLMEGEALASRILELGPVGAKFLGPVMIEVPHFGSLRGKEREMVILRSDNGETWREHTFEASDEAIQEIVSHSFDNEEMAGLDDNSRTTRILTTEFPHYIAVVSRVRQEVHAIGPEGGMVSSTVVPQVQAVFPQGALTKKIKVGLQAQPIPTELTAKLLGNRVAVSPIVTVEPRRRKFHKPISLTIPVPQAANKGMINQYSGEAPTLRLLCSITGGTTRAQWEDVTGSTPLTFVNDCVSFTTTVSARFWLMDCRNVSEATKMATELYREAIHVPFMAKFVVFAKRTDTTEARLRVFCMTDDKEDKTLEHQEHFTEVAKSRDVEVLEGKMQYLEFAGNLIPITKSGDQPKLGFRAFKENRLPFTVRVKDPHADAIGRVIFMREPKVAKGDVPQQPICILNIVLPDDIIPDTDDSISESHKHSYITHTSGLQRLSDISNLLGEDWAQLASELGVSQSEINSIKNDLCESSVAHQGLAMLRLWLQGNKASGAELEEALRRIGREDIVQQTVFNTDESAVLSEDLSPSYTTTHNIFRRATIDKEPSVIIETQNVKKKEDKDDDEKKYTAEEKIVIEKDKKITKEEKIVKEKVVEEKIIKEKVIEHKEKIQDSTKTKEVSEIEKLNQEKYSKEKEKTSVKEFKEEHEKTTSEKVKSFVEHEKVTIEKEKIKEDLEKEEKVIVEEKKSVSERKKEIEKRLSQDLDEKKKVPAKEAVVKQKESIKKEEVHVKEDQKQKEPLKPKEDGKEKLQMKPKEDGKEKLQMKPKETEPPKDAVKPKDVSKAKEEVKKVEEKEIAEEKAVSPEPAHLSFDEKRKSFELGMTPKGKTAVESITKEVVTTTIKSEGATERMLSEERKEIEALAKAADEDTSEVMTFEEKRRSFEKGLSMKKPGDKLPSKDKDKEKEAESKRISDYRRDSALFEEVSQGLGKIEKGVGKPTSDLLSPVVVKTPPPSPADFMKDAPDNKKWSLDEASDTSQGIKAGQSKPETFGIEAASGDTKPINIACDWKKYRQDREGGLYRDIKEGTIYPPQLGYSEFGTSAGSDTAGFETETTSFETETFSELLFSSSSSEEEDPTTDLGPETSGILYKISRQLDRVPKYFNSKRGGEEREDFLDVPEEEEGLVELQASVENMIEQIRQEEELLFPSYKDRGRQQDSMVPRDVVQRDRLEYDPVRSLTAIEAQISELIKQVSREEERMMRQLRQNEERMSEFVDYCRSQSDSSGGESGGRRQWRRYSRLSSDSECEEEERRPQVLLRVGHRYGKSTIDISSTPSTLRRTPVNRSLPNIAYQQPVYPPFLQHTSSIEYIAPVRGVGFVNEGYCIWTSDEDLLDEGRVEETEEEVKGPRLNGISTSQVESFATIEAQASQPTLLAKTEKVETTSKMEVNEKILPEVQLKQAKEEILEFETSSDLRSLEETECPEDVDRIIKEMESQLVESKRMEEMREESPKPVVTTPTLTRRAGGSLRLSQADRPTVSIVTDLADDPEDEELGELEEETAYYVSEPPERRQRRNVKFRFDSGDYRDDEESDREEEVKKTKQSESQPTQESEADREFQKIVSQISTEEMDEALMLWDKGGMTPSDLDSKSLSHSAGGSPSQASSQGFSHIFRTNLSSIFPTTFYGEASLSMPQAVEKPISPALPRKESYESLGFCRKMDNNTLEGSQGGVEEETVAPCQQPPPIPSPRGHPQPPAIPTSQLEDQPEAEPEGLLTNYAVKRKFWEEVSQGSTESQESVVERPPIPKPRLSISGSLERPVYSEHPLKEEAQEVAKPYALPESTTTESVERAVSKEESVDDSEMEYIQHHRDELSYDNDAFDDDLSTPDFLKKKKMYERSVSLPCEPPLDPATCSVRVKKRIFEAQIKKEMVVEQLMSQPEEEGSPEHKSLKQKGVQQPIADTRTIVTRQIHTDIFSDELDQQIDSLVPENKEIRKPFPKDIEKQEALFLETDSPDTSISRGAAEVLQYKNDAISKPSDSLEVHVDKSELEETEKEMDREEEMNALEEAKLQTPKDLDKVGSITSSQGESEDTFSESDVTPEDTRFKEQQEIQDWASQETKGGKVTQKTRVICTPEEHLPDTVWEVPLQETIENVGVETVQQIPGKIYSDEPKSMDLSESKKEEISKEVIHGTEVEISMKEALLLESTPKKEIIPETKRIPLLEESKFRRTDTTTSSMEITDEDLRSTGVDDSDISPLESQAHVFKDDDAEGDSSDDVDNLELSGKETFGEEVLEKTLAEVKESLEAVKEELIEEKKKKKDSITKESPSEFEFKVLSLDHKIEESIKESHYEEGGSRSDSEKPSDTQHKVVHSAKGEHELSSSTEIKAEVTIKQGEQDVIERKREEKEQEKEIKTEEIKIEEEKKEDIDGASYSEDSHGTSSYAEENFASETRKLDETEIIGESGSSIQSEAATHSQQAKKASELYEYDTTHEMSKENLKVKKTESKHESKKIEQENEKKTEIHASQFVSEDGSILQKFTQTSEVVSLSKIESSQQHFEKHVIQEVHRLEDFDKDQKTDDEDEKSFPKEYIHDEKSFEIQSKSPIHSDTQEDTSSSSEAKMTSGDKPIIVVRRHSKSKVRQIQGELSDPYSSSGESQFQSFEQTSESLKSPSSRPLSSDVEGLVANIGAVTGSSEYESAVSGQSTAATSRDYQTAVSSLSSRDSMKSFDSESSGNLASIEVSSEASETLVPSAMELDEVEVRMSEPSAIEEIPRKGLPSCSESGQSVSIDISTEEISEDEVADSGMMQQKMKRSHEMTFQPEPRPIVEELLSSSLGSVDDVRSAVSDSTAVKTVIELSRTESEKMDGSATSDQLTVSGTSEQLSLSESKDTESAMDTKKGTISTQHGQELGDIQSVTITTTSVVEEGAQCVSTQVTSNQGSHSNGPTQVEYNVEYDEIDVGAPKKRPGHRRNGSTSFKPSMIPVFTGRADKKKGDEIQEDSAESDKYSQTLTSKEGRQEEKKDIDEAEKLDDESYQTEADQGFQRDVREGKFLQEAYKYEEAKSFDSVSIVSGTKSRLSSVAFSEDRPDSELSELLKQCSIDTTLEDPIERPRTPEPPEPIEECEIKDDTPEFSSEAQASVTELEMEYSGAFSRSNEYEAHVSPIREHRWEHESEFDSSALSTGYSSTMPLAIPEEPIAEKHELETQELTMKEESTSPVPGITITQHMTPLQDESFVYPETIETRESLPQIPESISSKASSETSLVGKEYNLETASTKSVTSEDLQEEILKSNQESTSKDKFSLENDALQEVQSGSDSPTSDSFELLEKPDLADEFVIIEEVGKEAEEQDQEGKSVKILGRRTISRPEVEKQVVSPPTTSTKMTKIKYYTKGGAEEEGPFEFETGTPPKGDDKVEVSSQEGSPPSAAEDFKPEVEAGKKWIEMQFQGTEPVAPVYGYEMDFERGPLEDIKEEELADLESSSKIGSMGSQVSYSIGSFGSVKESLSSTPDYDLLAGRKFFTRSGEHDDVSMSSLQEFERLENLIAMESSKHRSSGSQDSLTSSSNSRKHGSKSGGDDISLSSLKEFEGLEKACIMAEKIEKKAKMEEETLLSEIEEGHESQASESESCVTVSVSGMQRGDSDEDDYDRRMFEIDEIIRQAQTNVEQFMDAKQREIFEKKMKSQSLGHADSLEEMTKVPDLDLDQPSGTSKPYCGKSYITQWDDIGEELLTSTDSLELKTQISKMSMLDPFTTSTDSLEVRMSQDVMSMSTDSIEAAARKKKTGTMTTDSIEVGEKTSMVTSTDSLEKEKMTEANSLEEEEQAALSISSGKETEWSREEEGAGGGGLVGRIPPPRAEYLLGSSDSLEPTSSTATHATYQYDTDSVMSSSFTSGDSTTMVDDDALGARATTWFDDGKPYVTEVIEPGEDEYSGTIHRTVEMPPVISKVSFRGDEAEAALREYIQRFDPGEDVEETRETDSAGNIHIRRVIQKRVVLRPEEMGGGELNLEGDQLDLYLKSLTSQQSDPSHVQTSHTYVSSQSSLSQDKGETIKSDIEVVEAKDIQRRGSGRPPLKYDISMDEEPEFDPREHDWRFNLHTHLEREEDAQDKTLITPSEKLSSQAEIKRK